ncbi:MULTISPECIES: DUF2267 domain-containing protein [unclassified Bradyrhizobium]|uniref:DUF2267 domain-containing protein n=1 Tax=unclassified Bradyrhizobium TaxID=2631580 RepID=UPI00247AC14B|nr:MULTISPECIES: DUF2267 domain-containing protein [unclassified Bradyrhizobium]WGR71778.1 DUF2267 domain-containing protein [Bradyrhizobium sp. ISRA426]WGR76613.1 DUF2267 domain-containing protein [Bradyrhizobium sp. ISRA430]WGR87018.1 DUF2267 domain-containing protein [Bradyrhizobium sp. ISRA432]
MGSSAVPAFESTFQTTHVWLKEIEQDAGFDAQLSWHVLGVILRAIRDRLPLGLAAHLGSQLPLLVRGIYYDQFRPSELPGHARTLDEFLKTMEPEMRFTKTVDSKDALRAVFHVLSRHLTSGQAANVREALPEEVRALWDDPAPAGRA